VTVTVAEERGGSERGRPSAGGHAAESRRDNRAIASQKHCKPGSARQELYIAVQLAPILLEAQCEAVNKVRFPVQRLTGKVTTSPFALAAPKARRDDWTYRGDGEENAGGN
jgi:hypothetical protein